MKREQLLALITQLGDEKIDNLRIEASTGGLSDTQKSRQAELAGLSRGQLIATIVDQRLGYDD